MTLLGLVALVLLTSCTGTGEDPVVTASPRHELRWVNIPQDGGGFGVPAEWHSTAAGTQHFGGLVAATRPRIIKNVVHADDDGLGGSISYVRLETLRSDDAFVSLTFALSLTGHGTKNHLSNEVVAADFSDSVDKHLGVPVREVDGWRNGDLSVRVRYWVGPEASEETSDELHMVLDRIELP